MKVIALLIPFSMREKTVFSNIPLHCCHQLQQICVGVMGQFKGKLHLVQHDWVTANPSKVKTVHDLASYFVRIKTQVVSSCDVVPLKLLIPLLETIIDKMHKSLFPMQGSKP